MKVIIERIRPENDGRLIFISKRLLLEPVQERFSRKTGNGALLRHPRNILRQAAQPRCLRKPVDYRGRMGREPGPAVYPAKRVGLAGASAVFIVVRQEFGLVRRHIDIDRTISLAAFAGQAEVERFLHFLALPPTLDDLATHGFEQQACAPARGMLLFACYLDNWGTWSVNAAGGSCRFQRSAM